MIVGGGTRERNADPSMGEAKVSVFNSVYHFSRDGKINARYDKMVPLPFGEYLPFADTFPWLADLIEGPSSFQAGTQAVVFESEHARIATPICYEAILTYVCQKFDSPQLFVNVTNDAWFGDTAASTNMHARDGDPRSSDPYTGPHTRERPWRLNPTDMCIPKRNSTPMSGELRCVLKYPTFYRTYGDWFVALCLLILLAAAVVVPWRRKRTHGAS